jgi:hypothetical protein
MQPVPLTRGEVVAILSRRMTAAEAAGLSHGQAITVVSHEYNLDPAKVEALVASPLRVVS